MKICIVCQKQSKYKCPKCKSQYCNPSCFKIHECKVLEKIIENNQNSELNELVLDEDNDHIVQKDKLQKLIQNQQIVQFLKNKTLQEQIKSINGNKTQLKTLNTILKNDKDFENFCNLILKEMNYLDDQNCLL